MGTIKQNNHINGGGHIKNAKYNAAIKLYNLVLRGMVNVSFSTSVIQPLSHSSKSLSTLTVGHVDINWCLTGLCHAIFPAEILNNREQFLPEKIK